MSILNPLSLLTIPSDSAPGNKCAVSFTNEFTGNTPTYFNVGGWPVLGQQFILDPKSVQGPLTFGRIRSIAISIDFQNVPYNKGRLFVQSPSSGQIMLFGEPHYTPATAAPYPNNSWLTTIFDMETSTGGVVNFTKECDLPDDGTTASTPMSGIIYVTAFNYRVGNFGMHS